MIIKRSLDLKSSDITDEQLYLRRREFMRLAGGAALAVAASPLLTACGSDTLAAGGEGATQTALSGIKSKVVTTDEKLNSFEDITSYNNFYEFGTGKDDPARYANRLKTSPWKVKIDGLCAKPAEYLLEDLIKPFQLEERIYRLRCVEAWSMVIPWVGIPLSSILKRAEPTAKATFVEFTTLLRPSEMPGQNQASLTLALQGGSADGRGHASVDDRGRRSVWQVAHESERRADPAGRALEVRLQEHQVGRAHPARRQDADERLERGDAERVPASTRT